jgi:5'-3' exonuclease
MGIPCYFSQLIRRHKAVVVKYRGEQATNFCLDSNSIVYDAVRDLPYSGDVAEYEAKVIALVCARIAGYIAQVRPKRVCIAFDGVPPMAKMKQQRERRHKSRLEPRTGWETVQITPGTKFMKKLDAAVHAHFEPMRGKYEFLKITTSDEPGEGEHKIFEWLRTNPGGDTFVYGLDSDLIILALHHLKYGKIKLLREAPAFNKDQGLQLLDANLLATQINSLMGADKVPDYVFITLFLGNDFMPHFPALNLRTRGLDVLLATYKSVVGGDRLFDGANLNWPVVRRFVAALAKRESADFAKEYADRNNRQVDNTPENKPMVRREVEHYIQPPSPGWEDRYYRALLKMDAQNSPQLCRDFYDILTWNVQYYTTGCPDWDLYYPHMYPPLLRDLAKFDYTPRPARPSEPKSSVDLLKFVMPAQCAHYSAIEYMPAAQDEPQMHWAFCTFSWEAHLLF